MAPSMKTCPECQTEVYAFQLPRHLFSEHGIGEKPKTRGPSKNKHKDVASVVRSIREEDSQDPSIPGQSAEASEIAGYESGSNGEASQHDMTPPGTLDEVAPRKPGFLDRFRSRRGRGRGGQAAAPATRERPPRRPRAGGRRVALDSDISDIWAFGGRRLQNTAHFPTGRMLEYQAPAAGVILDRAIAGTLPDRMLFQPIARNRDKYEDVGFLLAGPLLTFTITSTGQQMQRAIEDGDQELFDSLAQKLQMQQEMFRWVVRAMLPRLAEGVKKAREKEEKEARVIAEVFPDLGIEDPVEEFASRMFQPPNFEEASQNGNAHPAPDGPDREDLFSHGG